MPCSPCAAESKLTAFEADCVSWAVLVAIAIPVFTSLLNKSQLATDTANIRCAYADACVTALAYGEIDADGKTAITITDQSQYSTATVDNNAHVVTITHSKDSNLTKTFTIDEDVTLTIN